MTITPEIEKRVEYWLSTAFDEKTRNEVKALREKDPQGLIDAFFSDLSFGTGGMRGIMGVGTCRLNVYTIRLATQGLANYLQAEVKNKELSVVIGFDSRRHSQEFAREAARVLSGNQIRVYLIDQLRPTPYISFACRFLHADAAIMITASHNPKDYNGYKVYWSDGAQVVFPHDAGIVAEVKKLSDLSTVKMSDPNVKLIEVINPEENLDSQYLKAIAPLQHFPEVNHLEGSQLKIAYTSLHGTGITIVPKALKEWGFTTIVPVAKQCEPDPEFPTVKFPNPEYRETLQMGIDLLEQTQSDIVIANDPDADRIGIVAMHNGKPVLLNGNEMAAICVDFLCELTAMPKRAAFVTTIVTTELLKAIASNAQASCFEVLTGFKYIGEKIHQWESEKEGYQFLFGAEESYGYLLGTHARDKDAIISSCLIAEIALHAKLQEETLIDRLYAIYQKHGIYREKQVSLNFAPGKEGMEQMEALMKRLRTEPHREIAGSPVIYIEDYMKGTRTYLSEKQTEAIDLPTSDVLLYRLRDKSRLVIRPSGTEPKIKIYGSVYSKEFSSIASGIANCDIRLDQLLQALKP